MNDAGAFARAIRADRKRKSKRQARARKKNRPILNAVLAEMNERREKERQWIADLMRREAADTGQADDTTG